MSIDDLYGQTLVVKHAVPDGTLDDYGQPVTAEATVGTVAGVIQPLKGTEVPTTTDTGAVIYDHRAYLAPLAGLDDSCWIEYGGARYDIHSIEELRRPRAGDTVDHLELLLRRVG